PSTATHYLHSFPTRRSSDLPSMSFGNENIAGRGGINASPREFIIQLLTDSGIPGYGHRYNMLDPQWTHLACIISNVQRMDWCIQDRKSTRLNSSHVAISYAV